MKRELKTRSSEMERIWSKREVEGDSMLCATQHKKSDKELKQEIDRLEKP